MTVLYSSNFDSGTGTESPAPGFTTFTSAPGGLVSTDRNSEWCTSGIRGIESDTIGACAYVTSVGSITNTGIRTATKILNHSTSISFIGHMFRATSTQNVDYVSSHYRTILWMVGGSLSVSIRKVELPVTNGDIGTSGYILPVSNGDIVHHETLAIGSTIETRIWKNSNPRPASPSLTVTDSSFASGYVGLYKEWMPGSDVAVTDDVVITDGAGGEDYFYPESSTPTATITATTALPAFSGSAQVAPVTSITVTTALPAFSGGASTGSAETTVTATTSLPSFSGSATGDTSSGVLTLPVMKNNTGTVLANETGATVHVYAVSTGNKVVTKTGQTTNASGVMTVTDALIVGGTQYRVVVVLGSGAEGLDKVTAS